MGTPIIRLLWQLDNNSVLSSERTAAKGYKRVLLVPFGCRRGKDEFLKSLSVNISNKLLIQSNTENSHNFDTILDREPGFLYTWN